MTFDDHLTRLVTQLWNYRLENFAGRDHLFDDHREPSPPVFAPDHADWNILLRPGADDEETKSVLGALPASKRHPWFRSMKSTQALAQSVFGNLRANNKLGLLSSLLGDDGQPLFFRPSGCEPHTEMEHEVGYLKEKGQGGTNVGVLLNQGSYRIAVECKLAEADFGRCSKPLRKPEDTDYEHDYCNADYAPQQNRRFRCSLAGLGVAYWEYIPELFDGWSAGTDHCPCPLNRAYQLTRDLLAACVRPGLSVDPAGGHVVLIYDDRNPSFRQCGEAGKIYDTVKTSLRNPALLQKTTWQQVVACLRPDPEMAWLAEALAGKYGIA